MKTMDSGDQRRQHHPTVNGRNDPSFLRTIIKIVRKLATAAMRY